MLRIALTAGRKVSIVSSWKLEISATVTDSGSVRKTSPVYARPIFPTTKVFLPESLIILPRSAVVVVFPFVPVIARTLPRSAVKASSTSLMTGSPRSFSASTPGLSVGTPGLSTTQSRRRRISSGRLPKRIVTFSGSASFPASSLASSSAFSS